MPSIKTNYNKNFLTSVLVRVDFQSLSSWENQEKKNEIQAFLKEFYPKSQTIKGQDLELITGKGITPTVNSKVKEGYMFKSVDEEKRVVYGEDSFVFEVIKYGCFTDFINEFKRLFEKFSEIYSFTVSSRFGIRYINNIKIEEGRATDWKGYINNALFQEFKDFILLETEKPRRTFHSLEFASDLGVLRFLYGMYNSEYPNQIVKKEFVLDYDYFTTDELQGVQLFTRAKEFNDYITNLFERSIGDKLRQIMNE